jgi:hypothetical protein
MDVDFQILIWQQNARCDPPTPDVDLQFRFGLPNPGFGVPNHAFASQIRGLKSISISRFSRRDATSHQTGCTGIDRICQSRSLVQSNMQLRREDLLKDALHLGINAHLISSRTSARVKADMFRKWSVALPKWHGLNPDGLTQTALEYHSSTTWSENFILHTDRHTPYFPHATVRGILVFALAQHDFQLF